MGFSDRLRAVVLAQAVEDPNAAAKVRRVVCASVFIMLLNIVCYAVPFALTKFPLSMLALLGFGLGVPACGYFGARNRSKPLLGCFWCMNCCNLVTLIILLCISGVFLAMFRPLLEELPAYADCCDQFRNCDWNASAVGCSSCIVNNADAPVTYMQERCDADGIEPAASSTFQSFVATSRGTEDYSDMEFDASGSGSSADEQKSLCLGRRECQIIVYIRHWRVTGTVVGVFLTLFILLMLPTVSYRPPARDCVCLATVVVVSSRGNSVGAWP